MKETKPAKESLTIRSSLISMGASLASGLLIAASAPASAILIPALAATGVSVISSLTAIWGRIRATKKIEPML